MTNNRTIFGHRSDSAGGVSAAYGLLWKKPDECQIASNRDPSFFLENATDEDGIAHPALDSEKVACGLWSWSRYLAYPLILV
jgi:hypothetical protein